MRKITLVALSLTSISVYAQDYWCLDNRISIYADYGYIHRRGGTQNFTLVENTSELMLINGLIEPERVLSSKRLDRRMHWESAIRGGVVYHSDACGSLEATYTFFYPWEANTTVRRDGTLRFPFLELNFGIDYENADQVVALYRSKLQNGELNYWGHVTPQRVNYFSFSWNMGFRVMELEEKLRLAFTRRTATSFYTIRTDNILYGAQLGAMLQINPSCCWTWTFLAKGAAFFNTAENKVKITDEDNTFVLRKYKKKRWTDSYLIEAYGQLAYHWNSYFSLHFGYQGFILTGVALAPQQRDIRSVTKRRIRTKGQIDMNGMYGGVSFGF